MMSSLVYKDCWTHKYGREILISHELLRNGKAAVLFDEDIENTTIMNYSDQNPFSEIISDLLQ